MKEKVIIFNSVRQDQTLTQYAVIHNETSYNVAPLLVNIDKVLISRILTLRISIFN